MKACGLIGGDQVERLGEPDQPEQACQCRVDLREKTTILPVSPAALSAVRAADLTLATDFSS